MQKQLEKLLKEMGLKADREFPVGPYVLDFALQKKRVIWLCSREWVPSLGGSY